MMEVSGNSPLPAVKGALSNNEDAVNMLLSKLDEGTQTVMNLRSILTLKTAELNELLAQLELTNQAITTVESTTAQIEIMLKDLGLSDATKESLLNAGASLDSAIKSASVIYNKSNLTRRPSATSSNGVDTVASTEKRSSNARFATTRIKYKPDTKHILRKLNDLVRELALDSGKFFSGLGTTDDYEILQKAYVDLDIAKTISLSAKSNMKRRNILIRSARRRNNMDGIKTLGEKIREGVSLWMTYTGNAPLLVNGENIVAILDREDSSLAKNSATPASRLSYDDRTNSSLSTSSSGHTKTVTMRSSLSNDSSASSKTNKSTRTTLTKPLEKLTMVPRVPDVVKETSIPSPTLPVPTKKPFRASTAPRPMKANIGLPRVRTSSVTQAKSAVSPLSPNKHIDLVIASQSMKTSAKPSVPMAKTVSSLTTKKPITPTASVVPEPENSKKSQLKPPSQRGPGSQLRLRSMLAKRSSLKPPTAVHTE
ncbi:hypothetical protein BY458DRAFT_586433 [Sporodiniella umbellata]|nr:hypothetical protein BY458DRAFT_586433 [Sporodiniella umbellata]